MEDILNKLNNAFLALNIDAKAVSFIKGSSFIKVSVVPPIMKTFDLCHKQQQLAMQLKVGAIPVIRPDYNDGTISIEIPNDKREFFNIKDIFNSQDWKNNLDKNCPIILGKTVDNKIIIVDLYDLPHLLIAGTTGSGKSIVLKAIIESILAHQNFCDSMNNQMSHSLIIIDPKSVEFVQYKNTYGVDTYCDGIQESILTLRKLVQTMNDRFSVIFPKASSVFKEQIHSYLQYKNVYKKNGLWLSRAPDITVIIDELADIILTDKSIEQPLCLLAQKGRAAGINLVVATQRPSADILTGLIRSNLPAKICLKVGSKLDGRIVFGSNSFGAEQLTGKGDMLFLSSDKPVPIRLQAPFVD